jgi:hypothetical protein
MDPEHLDAGDAEEHPIGRGLLQRRSLPGHESKTFIPILRLNIEAFAASRHVGAH